MNELKRWKRPAITAILTAFLFGLAVHMFGLVNVMHNHDSIHRIPDGYGAGVTSGRWLLTILGDLATSLFGGYNMPWVNGVIFIAVLAVGAGVIASVFKVKKHITAALIGMVFVCFPSVSSTMFYRFTVVYYGISILFAVLAAWILERYKYGMPFAVLLIAFSMGIYQSYVPFTIALFVLLLIQKTLSDDFKFWPIVRRGLYYCLTLALGVGLYYLLMNLSLLYYDVTLTDYQGINEMGSLSLVELPYLVVKSIGSVLCMPFRDYADLSQTILIKLCYLAIGILSIAMIVLVVLKKSNKTLTALATAVLCVVLPLAANFIVVMCSGDQSNIYTLMVYPVVSVVFLPLVLVEILPTSTDVIGKTASALKKCVAFTCALLIFCYSYQVNINYTSLYYANTQVQNYLSGMVAQIRMTEGFDTEKKWVFIGTVNDPLSSVDWNDTELFGGNKNSKGLLSSATFWHEWFEHYVGVEAPMASKAVVNELKNTEEVKAMPCWPNEGSVKVIGDYVVIKCKE